MFLFVRRMSFRGVKNALTHALVLLLQRWFFSSLAGDATALPFHFYGPHDFPHNEIFTGHWFPEKWWGSVNCFSASNFLPLQTALLVVLTVISAGGRLDRSASVTLVRQWQSLAPLPPFYFLLPFLPLFYLAFYTPFFCGAFWINPAAAAAALFPPPSHSPFLRLVKSEPSCYYVEITWLFFCSKCPFLCYELLWNEAIKSQSKETL